MNVEMDILTLILVYAYARMAGLINLIQTKDVIHKVYLIQLKVLAILPLIKANKKK